ncbi:MAG: SRPBCC family protein [Chitinophagaceae bacterium]|nr:SRPBCC family protein [Chitinophagaceae bacterium]
MSLIILTTSINAPIQRCFDLSRSIDLHMHSTSKTKEKAIAGVTAGLIGSNESVIWRAKHLGVYQQLTVAITAFDNPNSFTDTMVKGIFKSMQHEHRFESKGNTTIMTDHLHFKAPLGILGTLAEKLFLTDYMKCFLLERNQMIKTVAESETWRKYLPS